MIKKIYDIVKIVLLSAMIITLIAICGAIVRDDGVKLTVEIDNVNITVPQVSVSPEPMEPEVQMEEALCIEEPAPKEETETLVPAGQIIETPPAEPVKIEKEQPKVKEQPKISKTVTPAPEVKKASEPQPTVKKAEEKKADTIYVIQKDPIEKNVYLDYDKSVYLQQVCDSYGFPYDVVYALMYRESRFNTTAVNKWSDAAGLMQIMPESAEYTYETLLKKGDYDIDNHVDIMTTNWKLNIEMGVKILCFVYKYGAYKGSYYGAVCGYYGSGDEATDTAYADLIWSDLHDRGIYSYD